MEKFMRKGGRGGQAVPLGERKTNKQALNQLFILGGRKGGTYRRRGEYLPSRLGERVSEERRVNFA